MSYCRWSSMDFKCDLYVYDAEDGIAIHVASNRVVGDVPSIDWSSHDQMFKTYREQMEFMDTAEREPINLPYDGESWYGLDKGAACTVIEMLEEEGYIFPEGLCEYIMEDEE